MQITLKTPPGFRLTTAVRSHGWYDLPPFAWDGARLTTVAWLGGVVGELAVTAKGDALTITARLDGGDLTAARREAKAMVTSMLRLDEDLAPLYALTDADPQLAYARPHAAGRLLRAPTAFEDVIKMLLTTNCSWALTKLMVTRLVAALGAPSPTGAHAFPTPQAMAARDGAFYRDVVRAGYRAPHLAAIARAVVAGDIAPERWRVATGDDETVRDELMALPGIGPYAADNLMRLCGRYGYLGLDSWCRGKLKKLYPRIRQVDAFAQRRYRSFGRFRGLAMWLELTRDWHDGDVTP